MSSDDSTPSLQPAGLADGQALFPYSFIEIIDADHAAINRLAGKIRKLLASSTANSRLSELHSLLLEVTWRLIRHDFSEDVVMRPAFVAVLGDYGAEMVERDRTDHAGGRGMLLNVLREVDLAIRATNVQERRDRKIMKVAEIITEAFDELAEHMKVESGEVLPRLETVISADMSAKLAREYADTLLLTPDLTRTTNGDEGQSTGAVFGGGVAEYINATPVELRQHYQSILEDTKTQAGRLWFDEMTDKELGKIRIHKKPTIDTTVKREVDGRDEEPRSLKVPTNALGLPVRWDHFRKGKL